VPGKRRKPNDEAAAPAESAVGPVIFTIGHSTRTLDDFMALLEREGIQRLVDVRAFPVSRRYPHFDREPFAASLRARDIDYVHAPALGGRRKPRPDSPNTVWRNDGFRGYADYMSTDSFRAALDDLIALGAERPTTVMCAEAVPWRCHRSMISDALVARGIEVRHIMDDKTSRHSLPEFASASKGEVRYGAQSDLFEV
jgi:uncharacterized protein (DUF488 family)